MSDGIFKKTRNLSTRNILFLRNSYLRLRNSYLIDGTVDITKKKRQEKKTTTTRTTETNTKKLTPIGKQTNKQTNKLVLVLAHVLCLNLIAVLNHLYKVPAIFGMISW